MINSKKSVNNALKKFIAFPEYEEGRILSFNDYPIKEAFIGTTSPFAEYEINNRYFAKYHLLEYILKGEGEVFIDGKWRKIKEGQTLFFYKNTPHSIRSSKTNPLKKVWTSFSCNYLDSMMTEFRIRTGIYSVDTLTHFETLKNLSENPIERGLVCAVANNIHSILTNIAAISYTANNTLLANIKNKLDSLIYDKCTLKSLADQLNISKSTIIKVFKKAYGVTPYQYLIDRKIEISKEYLKTSKITIKTIAFTFSFTDEHYYTYMFTKKVKMSPSEYRKKYSPLSR